MKIIIKNHDTIYCHYDTLYYDEVDKRGNELRDFHRYKDEISGYDYSSNPIFGIYKEFYPNGNIKLKGLYCCFGFNIGQWFNYDNNGKLIKTINNDLGYTFNTDSLINFCKKNAIPLKKVEWGFGTYIHKRVSKKGKLVWVIQYPDFNSQQYITLSLDAKKGKVLNTTYSVFPIGE